MYTKKQKVHLSTPSAADLRFLVSHIILPPKLPQKSDGSIAENRSLLSFVADCAYTYPDKRKHPQWAVATKMLEDLLWLRSSGSIPGNILKTAIREMRDQGLCMFIGPVGFLVELTHGIHADVIAINIAAQNAGLIMRHTGDEIHFESFELSPTAGEVMGTNGRLTCSFPGPVMAVGATKIQNPAFLDELVRFLERMDWDVLEDAMPSTRKAGSRVVEERDTASPMYITAMLAGIFRAIGRPVDDVSRIQKQVRDDVVWSDAKLPWRRSALWLLIRVAIQTTVQGDCGLYKSFMIHLMSRLLYMAERGDLGSDTLFVMRAKLSRRVEKAGGDLPKSVLQRAGCMIRSISGRLCRHWELEQKHGYSCPSFGYISVGDDIEISLKNGKSYIAGIASRPEISDRPQGSCPLTTTHRVGSDPNSLPSINNEAVSIALGLSDFERWVERSLDSWLSANLHRVEICRQLADRIDRYTTAAKECYKSKPDDLSVMLLISAMLWVALDTAAVRHCRLLRNYRPEIPHDALEPLILSKKTQMQALHRVEQYILKRERECVSSNPSIYANDIASNTFAVAYCTDSSSHQNLNERIENWAKKTREEKKEEFRRNCVRREELLDQIDETTCECYYKRRRKQVCRHHRLVKEANSIRIWVNEWPLPRNHLHRWVVIFELDCPPPFCAWRDATYKLLAEVFAERSTIGSSRQAYGNIRKDELSQYFSDRGQRITLKSSTKSFLKSHYSSRNLPTSIDEICVENGLTYHLHDGEGWVANQLGRNDVRSMCTPTLPKGIYRSLQWVVQGTTHMPNEVIARQSECHPELLNHEYDAFGLLRCGNRLQWLNIARELRARNLSFGQEAVNVLILHAVWQAGPSEGSVIRQAHFHLAQLGFGKRLIDELGVFWDSIQGNWLEVVGANTLIRLTCRLLSFAVDTEVRREAVDLLRRARSITLGWTREVVELAGKQIDQDNLRTLRSRILMLAATCRATYDVDPADLSGMLSSDDDVATAVECAIMIQRNTPPGNAMLSEWTCRLLERDRRLSSELEPELQKLILASNNGINTAIIQTGYSFTPGTRWRSKPVPNERWLFMETLASPEKRASNVCYNLLDGLVLIDGSPLGRLPESFTTHETYRRTFGNVSPSSLPPSWV